MFTQICQDIFKAYDIRGIVGQSLTDEAAFRIGRAIGSEAVSRRVKTVVIGRDGRLSSPKLAKLLAEGLQASGIDVIDIGLVATPVLYFGTHYFDTLSGVMVTGSHNPPNYNGFKMVLAGDTLAGEIIQQLYQRILNSDFSSGDGQYCSENINDIYIERIVNDCKLSRNMNIVVDCGNGVAGHFAPNLYRRMGCKVRELFCEVDGHFPNHHPDPAKPENMQDLVEALAKTDAEIGLAFDGDGDRLGIVTKDGNIIWPDRQLMIFAADVLSRRPGATIIYDVKSTRLLAPWIKENQGKPMMCRTGHSYIKAAIKESGAALAGEMSGHVFFKERWYGFDDGLYAGARMLEILSQCDNPSELLNQLPNAVSTPELNIKLNKDGENHQIITKLQKLKNAFPSSSEMIDIDGVRIEYKDGFGLARASNTTPVIVLRFEADNEVALSRIQEEFRRALSPLTTAELPF